LAHKTTQQLFRMQLHLATGCGWRQSGAGLLFGGYDDDDLGEGLECVLAGAV